ncbi:MAG: rhodanese-like domain-containing protein [Hahellaceae bacterium]|nr:rhodanese-like domain-containing protein [Hahellaceae bacterium]MCP5168826.1 rhodanese-like domain-containing protein [Hahellaceae bacterium]
MDRLFDFVAHHWLLVSAFLGLLGALFLTERQKSGASLSPQQVVNLMNNDDAVVIDIREKKEFSEGKITGSIHIPFTALKDRASELEKYREKCVILVDKAGQHSAMAGKQLGEKGFTRVARLSGGISEWKNANLPLVKK